MSVMQHRHIVRELSKIIALYCDDEPNLAADALISLARHVYQARKAGAAGDTEKAAGKAQGEAVRRLFAYWQTQCDHARAKPTQDRLTKIRARLREGYTEADIRRAIDGAATAAYETDGRRFDDISLICRNGAKLESFIARAGEKVGGEAPAPTTPAAELRRAMAKAHAEGDTALYDRLHAQLKAVTK